MGSSHQEGNMNTNPWPHTLEVTSNGRVVGILRKAAGRLSFEYAADWVAAPDAFPIAPSFPLLNTVFADGEEQQWVSSFFDNLLPEEKPRKLLASEASIPATDTWKMLCLYGAETAGALALRNMELPAPAPAARRALSLDGLAERISNRGHTSMIAGAPKQVALAGAQAKLAMIDDWDGLFEPVGNGLSTHILKPDSDSEWYPNTAANEQFCMTLAAVVGLSVPKTRLYHIPAPVFVVERFDRVVVDGECRARHVVDGAQLLALSGHLKYEMMTANILKLCCELTDEPNTTSRRLLDWTIFNVLIGNSDAHLKNISFFLSKDNIVLAPFYDVLSTAVYATPDNIPFGPFWPEVKLSMEVGHAERYDQITRDDILAFGATLGISKTQAAFQLDVVIERVLQHAERIFSEMKLQPGERRLVNAIRQLPIREMTQRLGART